MKARAFVSAYRWPLYLGGLLTVAIVANGVLVYVATRPDTPRPVPAFYEASLAWDADEAVEAASRQLGWVVSYDVPAGVPHVRGMPRPIDVVVVDAAGRGVTGLTGRLLALRPSDSRLNQAGVLVELPQRPGSYRSLVRLDLPGLWELRVDVRRGAARFVHGARVTVPSDAPSSGGPT